MKDRIVLAVMTTAVSILLTARTSSAAVEWILEGEVEYFMDWVTVQEGEPDRQVDLRVLVCKPAGSPPPEGWPGLFRAGGAGGAANFDVACGETGALAGYVTLSWSARGQYMRTSAGDFPPGWTGPDEDPSFDGFHFLHPDFEYRDVEDLRAWFDDTLGVTSPNPMSARVVDTTRVGILGESLGGGTSWWTAGRGLFSAYAPAHAGPGQIDSALPQGVMLRLIAAGLGFAYPEPDTEEVDLIWPLMEADDVDAYLELAVTPRSDYVRDDITAPLLYRGAWQDGRGWNNSALDAWFARAVHPDKKLYVTTAAHCSDFEPDEIAEQDALGEAFVACQLKGDCAEYDAYPPITIGFDRTWEKFELAAWPTTSSARLHFWPGEQLRTDPPLSVPPPSSTSYSQTMLEPYDLASWREDSDGRFDQRFILGLGASPKMAPETIVFRSPPLPRDVRMLGAPTVHLYLESDGGVEAKYQAIVHVFDEDPSYSHPSCGPTVPCYNANDITVSPNLRNPYLVTRAVFAERETPPTGVTEVTYEGEPIAHCFPRGHRIRIEVGHLDLDPRHGIAHIPFFHDYRVELRHDVDHLSWVEIPYLDFPTPACPSETADFWEDPDWLTHLPF